MFFSFLCSVPPVPSPLKLVIRITVLREEPSTEAEDRIVTRDLSSVSSHHCQGGTMGPEVGPAGTMGHKEGPAGTMRPDVGPAGTMGPYVGPAGTMKP